MKPEVKADSKDKEKKVKKPMNAFFVYRKALRERIIEKYGTTKSHEISKIAGECWAMEPVHVKNYFRDISFKLHEDARMEKMKSQRRPSTASDCSDVTTLSFDSSRRTSNISSNMEAIQDFNLNLDDKTETNRDSINSSYSSPYHHQRSLSMSSVSSTSSIYQQIPDFPVYQPQFPPHLYPISDDVMNATGEALKSMSMNSKCDVDLEQFKPISSEPVKLEDFL